MNIKDTLKFMYSGIEINNSLSENSNIITDSSKVEARKVLSLSSRDPKYNPSGNYFISDLAIINITKCITFNIALIIISVVYLSINKVEIPCFVEQIIIAIATSSTGLFFGIFATIFRIPKEYLKPRND